MRVEGLPALEYSNPVTQEMCDVFLREAMRFLELCNDEGFRKERADQLPFRHLTTWCNTALWKSYILTTMFVLMHKGLQKTVIFTVTGLFCGHKSNYNRILLWRSLRRQQIKEFLVMFIVTAGHKKENKLNGQIHTITTLDETSGQTRSLPFTKHHILNFITMEKRFLG